MDAFLSELGGSTDVSEEMREKIASGLAAFADDWRAREDAVRRWQEAFWGETDKSNDELVALENERRAKSEPCMMPSETLGFLFNEEWVPSVKFDVPAPDEALDEWAVEIADPTLIYGPPEACPPVEESRRVRRGMSRDTDGVSLAELILKVLGRATPVTGECPRP